MMRIRPDPDPQHSRDKKIFSKKIESCNFSNERSTLHEKKDPDQNGQI